HDGLAHLAAAADRARQRTRLLLFVVGGRIAEPAVELVVLRADERIADHGTTFRAGSRPSAITTRNGRSCSSAGMRRRASATLAGSMSATMTPGSVPASAINSPH